jgi:hypothetical protein
MPYSGFRAAGIPARYTSHSTQDHSANWSSSSAREAAKSGPNTPLVSRRLRCDNVIHPPVALAPISAPTYPIYRANQSPMAG